ncbi:5'-nucleotidase [Bifidobacterium sp. ESL0798]|nr:5'-nucleotidase [Bifidobacterium sp. ESL0798]WEV74826.1 5'-nucleotidase [Bifidobacterium sp. ESL0798]
MNIRKASFTTDDPVYPYMEAYKMLLSPTTDKAEVSKARRVGLPVGLALPYQGDTERDSGQIRIAFDFDGILAGIGLKRIYAIQGELVYDDSEQKTSTNQSSLVRCFHF